VENNSPTEDLGHYFSDLPDPSSLEEDKDSEKEAKNTFGDTERNEEAKQMLHKILMILLFVGACCLYLVIVVRVLHFILPEYQAKAPWYQPHCWLNDTQLQGIDKFFFSGALGAMVSGYLKEKISLGRKSKN
jgi:hypothetical protein